ncbi:MAG: 3'-5' exonuclease [Solobacterium sp.]|nr:3'-5' exonuclease [Solobacterium sp.]
MKITAIDFETANEQPASVCAVGVSCLEDGAVEEKYYSLIQPEKEVGYFLSGNIMVHGIHPEDVKEAPHFKEVYLEMKPYLEDAIVVAHNARFDMGCLRAACLLNGIPLPHFDYFDTVELSKRVFPQLAHHRLNDMCSYMNIDLDHHHAGSDAYGCLMIVANIMNLAQIYDIDELLKQCNTKLRHF